MNPSKIREESSPYDLVGMLPLTLRVSETFEEFVRLNPDLAVEQNSKGEIVVMSPTGGETSRRNAEITFQLRGWSKRHGGYTFDSSVIFCLPDGSKRSPDASWIAPARWEAMSMEDRKSFPPICPDFVIELRSESDMLKELQDKMSMYSENGIRLGWLIDPIKQHVHVYALGKPAEIVSAPESMSNEHVLPGFVLDMKPIWAS
jgi:Uma2 family endonuclease